MPAETIFRKKGLSSARRNLELGSFPRVRALPATVEGSLKIVNSKTIDTEPNLVEDAARVLREGGLVCLPCNGSYRILADVSNPSAVSRLYQSKRRTGKAPSLVFIDSLKMLSAIATEVEPLAEQLASKHWPGPLTILFAANPDLHPKVRKEVVRAVGKIGVRVPQDRLTKQVISALGGPLLVSSANRQKKSGSSSPAQVRKNFVHKVDIFVDLGDLPIEPSSTVIDVEGDAFRITRPGAISQQDLSASLGGEHGGAM